MCDVSFMNRAITEYIYFYLCPCLLVLPKLEGECTVRGVRTLAYYGNLDSSEWSLYVGGMKLNWELVEIGGFSLDPQELYLSLEVPLYAPGMAYEVHERPETSHYSLKSCKMIGINFNNLNTERLIYCFPLFLRAWDYKVC